MVSVRISNTRSGHMLGPSLGTLALSDSPNSLRRLVSNVVSSRVQTQLLPRMPGPGLVSTGPAVPDTDPMMPLTGLNVRQRSTIALALFGGHSPSDAGRTLNLRPADVLRQRDDALAAMGSATDGRTWNDDRRVQ